MESWESGDERPRRPAREPDRGRSAAAIIGGILVAVLIIGGLVMVGLFVLVAVGMSQWGSNK